MTDQCLEISCTDIFKTIGIFQHGDIPEGDDLLRENHRDDLMRKELRIKANHLNRLHRVVLEQLYVGKQAEMFINQFFFVFEFRVDVYQGLCNTRFPAGPSESLHEGCRGFWNGIEEDIGHIPDINTHLQCCCGDHDLVIRRGFKKGFGLFADSLPHRAVMQKASESVSDEIMIQYLCLLFARGEDDPLPVEAQHLFYVRFQVFERPFSDHDHLSGTLRIIHMNRLPLASSLYPLEDLLWVTDRCTHCDTLNVIPAEMIKRRVEIIGNQEVLVLRGKLLPLISLNRFLGCEDSYEDPQQKIKLKNRRKRIADRRNNELRKGQGRLIPQNVTQINPRSDGRRFHSASGLNVIVVTTGSFSFALIVDKPLFTEEIVVKQLGKDLKSLSEYSGATILGDGRIALIIDVLGLAARSGILGQQNHVSNNLIDTDRNLSAENQALPFLCFKIAGPENYALPLFLVSRLEKIQPERLISCGDWRALQLEDKILPVFPVNGYSLDNLATDKEWGVIVLRIKSREIGLIAALPIQVIELIPEFDRQVFRRQGISGATVWKNESLLFIDILEIVASTRPELLEQALSDGSVSNDSTCIALLEPNSFFQNQLRLQLENHGCNVKIAESIAELEDCLSTTGHSIKGILADLSLVKKDQFVTLRKLKQSKQLDGIKIATLWLKEADRELDLSHEGISAHMLKLEMQQMTDWLDNVRSAT